MKLARWLARSSDPTGLTLDDIAGQMGFNGLTYPFINTGTLTQDHEDIRNDFMGHAHQAFRSNGPVFACMLVRQMLFSEARFKYRRLSSGRPGSLFGDKSLALVENPEPNVNTGNLLSRAIQDVDLCGNWYGYKESATRLRRLQPHWVTILLGSKRDDWQPGDIDTEVVGYMYRPGGAMGSSDPVFLHPDRVAHFAPIPDPTASYRGQSWITPIVREIMGDRAATVHKLKFLENGATPATVVKLQKDVKPDEFERWVSIFKKEQEGLANAYKWLYLGGGADVNVVGSNLRQIDFKGVQAASENRIATAAGVPGIIAGFSEGLSASTYSNYASARRRFADGTMRPLWRDMAASLSTLVTVPAGAELWYDDRDIPFLAEDLKDAAEVQQAQAVTIKMLIEAGYEADAAQATVTAGDFALLAGKHTGLTSVQLQPANTNSNGPAANAGRALTRLIGPGGPNGHKED